MRDINLSREVLEALGLGPDASDEEVNEAIIELGQRGQRHERLVQRAVDDALLFKKIRPRDRAWAERFANEDLGAFVDYVMSAPELPPSVGELLLDKVQERIDESGGRLDYAEALKEVSQENPDLIARYRQEHWAAEREANVATFSVSKDDEAEALDRARRLMRERPTLDFAAAMDEVLGADRDLARRVAAGRRRH
jgi:hypothetical protein